ncbi:MAG: thioredoxin TrxC [Epsilonproteobacteria bacterium]|nr:thioredoxin TrxC [Campylobacterota bacterium]
MEPLNIVCPSCLAVNRIPFKEHYSKANCGKCGYNLLDTRPIELNLENFQPMITKNDIPVIVDFWAPWCGPCQMMAPNFEEAAKQFPLKARFAKLNTELYPQIAATYAIRGIPTMIAFKQGEELDRVSGALTTPQIERWVNRFVIHTQQQD